MAQTATIPVGQEDMDLVDSAESYRQLAAAVFQAALEDLKASHPNDRRSALHFLFKSEGDFAFWCQHLDVDPEAFRRELSKHVLGPYRGLSALLLGLS